MRYLTSMAAVTATLAGCESLPGTGTADEDEEDEDDETPDPQQVRTVQAYYDALNRGGARAATRLVHPEADAGEVSEDGVTYFEEDVNIGVTDAAVRTSGTALPRLPRR